MSKLSRRDVVGGALGFSVLNTLPFTSALAQQSAEDRIVEAAKKAGPAETKGMIWGNYFAAMRPSVEEFHKLTGIGVGAIQDISIFDSPQRAMAEALSRSPQFDFFHVDSSMIPSLASAGLLEPLDEYIKASSFTFDAVGTFGSLVTYKGQTYGVPSDGNVMTYLVRKDLFEDPDTRKRFADKFGTEMTMPATWEEDIRLQRFLNDPEKNIWGSGNLRNRANGVTWYYMHLYSAGGFPFDDEGNPTLNTPAGNYALDRYLEEKASAHPEATSWGTAQMIPRLVGGFAATAQYWSGAIKNCEHPEKSKTAGKWLYGAVPGSDFSGKRLRRALASPMPSILINRYSPRKAQAAYLALWWGTDRNSTAMVSDNVNTFFDPWAKAHMTAPSIIAAYTAPAMKAIEKNLSVASPPIYLTGYLEFQDILGKNLSEAYLGILPAREALKKTEDEWGSVIRRIGKQRVREEITSYKALMPKIDVPA